jgi:phosphoglycolate phosphatase
MKQKIKAIIFDFDGVIHDTFELAYTISEKIRPGISREEYRSFFEGNLFKALSKRDFDKRDTRFREMEFKAFKELKLEKKIRKILLKLSKKYELYIISSNSIKNLNLYFENNNFTDVFKDILAYEAHTSKVKKFEMLFSKYNLNSDSCIFVTDTLGDILEAKKAGVKSIACTFGFHERDRLEKGKPYRIISNFNEIIPIIKELL